MSINISRVETPPQFKSSINASTSGANSPQSQSNTYDAPKVNLGTLLGDAATDQYTTNRLGITMVQPSSIKDMMQQASEKANGGG